MDICEPSGSAVMRNKTRLHANRGRAVSQEEARQTLAILRACRQTINVVLVALSDGVELEVWADGSLRRRSRFLRDSEARKYSDRLSARLTRRGYHNARSSSDVEA